MPPPLPKNVPMPKGLRWLADFQEALWKRGETTALEILDDLVKEGGSKSEGLRAKAYGKNSLEVKKDLLHKLRLDTAGAPASDYYGGWSMNENELQANASNMLRAADRRAAEGIGGPPGSGEEGVVIPGMFTRGIARVTHEPNLTHQRQRYGVDPEVSLDDSSRFYEEHNVVAGPRPRNGDRPVWKNLMKDPAFPKVAATAGAGAALLGANQASAATPSDDGFVPDSAPAEDGFVPDVAPPPRAPTPPVVAPVAAQPAGEDSGLLNNVLETAKGVGSDLIKSINPVGALSILEERVLDPYVVKPLQERVGKPLMEATINAQRSLVGKSAGEEYLQRIISIPIAGTDQFDHFVDSPEGLKAVNQLEGMFGTTGTAALTSLMRTAADVPTFILNPIAGALATPEMSVGDAQKMVLGFGAAGKVAGWAAKGLAGIFSKGGKANVVLPKEALNDIAESLAKTVDDPTAFKSSRGKPTPELELSDLTKAKHLQREEVAKGARTGNIEAKKASPKDVTQPKAFVSEVEKFKHEMGGVAAESELARIRKFDPTKPPVPPIEAFEDAPVLNRGATVALNRMYKVFDQLAKAPETVRRRVVESASEINNAFLTDIVPHPSGGAAGVIYGLDPKTGEVSSYSAPINSVNEATSFVRAWQQKAKNTWFKRNGPVFDALPERVQEALADPRKIGQPLAPAISRPGRGVGGTVVQAQPEAFDLPPGVVGNSDAMMAVLVDEKGGFKIILPDEMKAPASPPKPPAGGPPPPNGAEPMPPAPPPGPPPPPEAGVDNVMSRIAKNPSLYEQARRQLVGAHLRSPLDIASYVSDQQSLKSLERQWAGTMQALEKVAGKQGSREVRNMVHHMFKGDVDLKNLERLADGGNKGAAEAFTKLRDMVGSAIRKRDENQQWLASRGYVADESFSQSEGDLFNQYVAREYAAHLLPPGEWAKIARKDGMMMNRAIKGFKEWSKDPSMTDEEAGVKILDALRSDDPWHSLTKPGVQLKAGQHLRYRKDLPDWYRDLLGENRDGFLSISRTLATQDSLIQNFKIWEGLKADGLILDKPTDVNMHQLPDNVRQYGVAAGKYVSPELYDSMVTLPNVKYEGDKIVQGISNFVKTNQVSLGSFRTFMNMFMDNMMGGMLSGGVDVTRPVTTAKAMSKAARAIAEYSRNPLAKSEFNDFISAARRIGVDAPGHIGAEQTAIMRRQAADAMLAISGEKSYPGMLTRMFEAHQRFGAKTGGALVDWIDRVHKLASWEIVTNDLMRRSPQMTREQAMRAAARPIFESYPMYDRLAPLAERMRSGLVGIAAPYSTFAMERNRVLGSIPGRLMREPKLRMQLLKYGALGSAIYAGNAGLRPYSGVSQEDVDYVMEKRAGSGQEQFSPPSGVWVAPIRDGEGRPAVLDMTQWLAPLSYMQGDQSLGALNIPLNVIRAPLQGGMAGGMMDTALGSAGVQNPEFNQTYNPAFPWWINAGDSLIKKGLVPRILPDTYGNLQKAGMVGNVPATKEPLTGAQAALRTFPGIPFEQQPSDQAKQLQFQKNAKNAAAILIKAATLDSERARGPLQAVYEWAMGRAEPEAQRLFKKAEQMLERFMSEDQKFHEAKRKAERSQK